jgi:hypothetical protein
MAPRSGPTNIRAQIEHQTELLQDETDLALEASFAKMRQKFNAFPRCSAEEHALECATQEARFRKIRSRCLKPEYGTPPAVQWPIDRFVNAPVSTSDLEFF